VKKKHILKACCVEMVSKPTLGFSPVPFCTWDKPSAVFLGASEMNRKRYTNITQIIFNFPMIRMLMWMKIERGESTYSTLA
jgi:hypothetical protein